MTSPKQPQSIGGLTTARIRVSTVKTTIIAEARTAASLRQIPLISIAPVKASNKASPTATALAVGIRNHR